MNNIIEKPLKDLKVGIVGVGMVGGAVQSYFKKREFEIFAYDKGKNFGSMGEVNKADVVFICVPTPFNKETNSFDLSYVEETCEKIEGNKIIVIKSTVLPGTTEKLQEKYPNHQFLFNPEFLTEITADQDMSYPDRQIVGYTSKSKNVAGSIIQILPLAPYEKIIPATEAELVKYFGNTWFAVKVSFANQLYDLCEKLGSDYNSVMEAAAADKRIGKTHLDVSHKGYRGYGGKCLDGNEIVYEVDENGVKVTPLKEFQGKKVLSQVNGELIIDDVIAISQRTINQVIEISLSKGRSLKMSPDHLVVVLDNGKLIEKEAKDLSTEDKIPVAMNVLPISAENMNINFIENFSKKEEVFVGQVNREYASELKPFLTHGQYKGLKRERVLSSPLLALNKANISLSDLKIKTGKTGSWVPNSLKLNSDFARLVGYYLAEGCCSDNRVHLSFGYHEKELKEDTIQILNNLGFPYSTKVGYWKNKKSSLTFKISSRILTEYFKQFGKNCYLKEIPSYFFFAPSFIKDQLLSGLLRGDGSIEKSNMGNYYTISHASVSKKLIEGVDLLLRSKGILGSIKTSFTKKSKVPCNILSISEKSAVQKLLPLLVEDKKKKATICSKPIKSPAYKLVGNNLAILNIKKIKKNNKPTMVYALETASHYYLTSGGILTHNCLPKDTKALIRFAKDNGIDLKLHMAAEEINNELMRAQNIDDPETYSIRESF